MKSIFNTLLYLTILFISTNVFAQKDNFQGKIIYENQYQSNVTGVDDQMLNTMLGNRQEFFIKEGNYKFKMNGTYITEQFYDPVGLKLYTRFSSSDTLAWIDVTDWNAEVISHELVKTDEFILGMKCNALILTTSKGKETYYFNRQIKADPSYFQKHKFLNMGYVLKYTNAIPLKIVLENPEMNLTSTAIEIEPMEIEDKVFLLPDLPTKKSSF